MRKKWENREIEVIDLRMANKRLPQSEFGPCGWFEKGNCSALQCPFDYPGEAVNSGAWWLATAWAFAHYDIAQLSLYRMLSGHFSSIFSRSKVLLGFLIQKYLKEEWFTREMSVNWGNWRALERDQMWSITLNSEWSPERWSGTLRSSLLGDQEWN